MASKRRFKALAIVLIASVVTVLDANEPLHELRMILQQERLDDAHRTESAGMIKLGAYSEPLAWLKAGASFYGTLPFHRIGGELLGPEGTSGTLLGEAWIQAGQASWNLTAGRMKLEWPFLNSNDTSLIPNLFEAAVLQAQLNDHWSFTAGHAQRMAGWENGGDPYEFSDISQALNASMPGFFSSSFKPDHTPVTVAGLAYTSGNDEMQLWGGTVTDIMHQEYLEYTRRLDHGEIGAQLLLQQLTGALQDYHAIMDEIGINHTIVGIRGSWDVPHLPLVASAAYNRTWANTHAQTESSPDLCYGSGDVLFTSGYYETAHSRHGARGYKIGLATSEVSTLQAALNYTHLIEHSVHFDETSLVLSKQFSDLLMEGRIIRLNNGNDPESLQLRLLASYPF